MTARSSVAQSGAAPATTSARPTFTFAERVQGLAAPWMGRLPASLQYKLSGQPPIVIDGLTLHPQMQFIRAFQRKKKPFYRYCEPTVQIARVRLRKEALMFVQTPTPVAAVRDFTIPGPAGAVPVRHYTPTRRGVQPLLVFYHGGGFAVGDIEMYDEICRILCASAGMHVLSVDYRLAPEHPFPAGLHDAQAALRWAQQHAVELGADPNRVVVGGDSAGGNFSAVVSQVATRDGAPPAAQLLIYPTVDGGTTRRSNELFGDGFFLDEKDRQDFTKYYVGEHPTVTPDNPLLAPLHAKELSGLPPALVITAGFDILRDEGEEYAHALRKAGNVVEWERFPGFGHAFINMTGASPAAYDAVVKIGRDFRALVDRIGGA